MSHIHKLKKKTHIIGGGLEKLTRWPINGSAASLKKVEQLVVAELGTSYLICVFFYFFFFLFLSSSFKSVRPVRYKVYFFIILFLFF